MGRRWSWFGDRDRPHHDAALPAERTAMAWQRTALGIGGVSALLLHQAGGSLPRSAPGIFGLVMATVLLVLSELRYGRRASELAAGSDVTVAPTLPLLLTGTVSVLAIMAIWLSVVQG